MAIGIRGGAPLHVRFIGNSFTARNDLPGLIASLAAARGKGLEHRLISAGGASLRTHWNAGEALKAIRGGQYEHVVLQEQSTLPVKNARRMHENVRLFHEAIRAAGARTALYMTWARRDAPESQQAHRRLRRHRPGAGRDGRSGRPGLAAISRRARPARPARQGPESPHPGRVVSRRVCLPGRAVRGKPRRDWR